jgi:hypothetical protein
MKISNKSYNNGIDLARDVISEVKRKVHRTYWTNEEIDESFARRSANKIILDGTTCFMNPCLDLTLVSTSELLSRDIKHIFVIEEHLPTKYFPFNRLHFALEFEFNNKKYFINYKKCNEVHIYEGTYNGREDIPMAQIIRIPGKKINPNKSINENLGYDTLENLIKDKFKDYSLQANLNRLKKDNSLENFREYKKKYGENFNVIIAPQNQP